MNDILKESIEAEKHIEEAFKKFGAIIINDSFKEFNEDYRDKVLKWFNILAQIKKEIK